MGWPKRAHVYCQSPSDLWTWFKMTWTPIFSLGTSNVMIMSWMVWKGWMTLMISSRKRRINVYYSDHSRNHSTIWGGFLVKRSHSWFSLFPFFSSHLNNFIAVCHFQLFQFSLDKNPSIPQSPCCYSLILWSCHVSFSSQCTFQYFLKTINPSAIFLILSLLSQFFSVMNFWYQP